MAASKEYPDLQMARDVVPLFLVCAHNTNNVERFLKLVGERDNICKNGTFLHEMMLCVHSPESNDVVVLPTRAMTGVEIKPNGKYSQQVIDAYTETF